MNGSVYTYYASKVFNEKLEQYNSRRKNFATSPSNVQMGPAQSENKPAGKSVSKPAKSASSSQAAKADSASKAGGKSEFGGNYSLDYVKKCIKDIADITELSEKQLSDAIMQNAKTKENWQRILAHAEEEYKPSKFGKSETVSAVQLLNAWIDAHVLNKDHLEGTGVDEKAWDAAVNDKDTFKKASLSMGSLFGALSNKTKGSFEQANNFMTSFFWNGSKTKRSFSSFAKEWPQGLVKSDLKTNIENKTLKSLGFNEGVENLCKALTLAKSAKGDMSKYNKAFSVLMRHGYWLALLAEHGRLIKGKESNLNSADKLGMYVGNRNENIQIWKQNTANFLKAVGDGSVPHFKHLIQKGSGERTNSVSNTIANAYNQGKQALISGLDAITDMFKGDN